RDDPMGKTLTLDPNLRDNDGALTGETFDYTVTGVLKNIPHRSHFTFDFLLPSSNLNSIYGGDINTGAELNNWFWRGRIAHTYLLLQEDADPRALEAKFAEFQDRYVGDATRSRGYVYEPYLQRIDQIYLDGNLGGQLQAVGDVTNVYMFSIIALFILVIACINFMNLSTARSAGRAREVGMRKVFGAYRKQIVTQFLGESVLISLIAFVLALVLAWLILPVFYGYLNKEFVLDYSQELIFLLSLLGVGLFVGVFAGSYPAFFLSRFKPAAVLKGTFGGRARGSRLRKGLVVFQFAISAFLIIATLTVFKQLDFMRSYQLGFDQERVLVIPPAVARSLMPNYEAFREELLSNPQIADVTVSSGVPGQGGGGDIYVAKGAPAEDGFGLGELMADYNTLDFFGLELAAGRNFSREIVTDAGLQEDGRFVELAAIVNEEAVRQFGWDSPEAALGQQIIRDPNAVDWTATVIGVVKDFHFQSLLQPISPAALLLYPRYSYVSVKLQPGDIPQTVAFIEEKAQQFLP
ncbi:MAG: FtsX-like permease family protein, partial [Rhodothermales bacterium]